jgi:conjugal transfer pilin signal peptidase TrbI
MTNNSTFTVDILKALKSLPHRVKTQASAFKRNFIARLPIARHALLVHSRRHWWGYAAVLLAYILLNHQYHFGVGITNSLPYRFYLAKRDAKFVSGDYVTYLYQGFYTEDKPRTFVKNVGGVSGDNVSLQVKNAVEFKNGDADAFEAVNQQRVLINGVELPLAIVKPVSRTGRPMQALTPGVIPAGFAYLHAAHKDSFDSRYADIGLVPYKNITGRVIWMW